MRMRVPIGRKAGSAAMVPTRERVPAAVSPCRQKAVASTRYLVGLCARRGGPAAASPLARRRTAIRDLILAAILRDHVAVRHVERLLLFGLRLVYFDGLALGR